MPRIIAYTYDAAHFCPDCTFDGLSRGQIERVSAIGDIDEHNIPNVCMDGIGNLVHPVFDTDEQLDEIYCDHCSVQLE